MWKNLAACWAILLGIGFMMLANGLQGTLLGVRANIEGFATFTTGIMMSGYFIGLFIGSMLAPILVSRVGHIRVFSALASLASISILFHGIYIDPWLWMAMRVVTGISFAGFFVVTESWLNDRASNETRGKVLSVYMVIVTGSMGAGQFLLNLAKPDVIDLFILISVIISFGLIPILLTVKPAPSFGTSSKMSVIDLYRASPLAVIGNCLTGMAHGTIFGLGAIYASQVLVDIKAISWFMACFMIGSLVLQWPVGYISDRIGRRGVMAALSIVAIVCCVLAVFAPKDSLYFYLVLDLHRLRQRPTRAAPDRRRQRQPGHGGGIWSDDRSHHDRILHGSVRRRVFLLGDRGCVHDHTAVYPGPHRRPRRNRPGRAVVAGCRTLRHTDCRVPVTRTCRVCRSHGQR